MPCITHLDVCPDSARETMLPEGLADPFSNIYIVLEHLEAIIQM